MLFEDIRRFFKQQRALLAAQCVPAGLHRLRNPDRLIDLFGQRVAPCADLDGEIVRLGDRRDFALLILEQEGRFGMPAVAAQFVEPLDQRFAYQWIAQIDAGAVDAVGEDIAGQRDVGIALGLDRGELGDRIGGEFHGGHIGIGHAVDEAGIGAVLEQAADQIGKQILVASHRGIDPHRGAGIALVLGERAIDVFAHAVQALELELALAPMAAGERLDRADRIGIMGGEGRVDRITCRQQPLGAGEVGDIGRDLAGEDRETLVTAHLAQLDLGIPIGALDQPHEQLAAMPPRELGGPVAQRRGAFLVSLDREPETGPAAGAAIGEQRVVGDQRLENVEREFEPLGLLGIDGEMDIRIARLARQIAQDRDQRLDRGLAMEKVVFGIERGELDRNPR